MSKKNIKRFPKKITEKLVANICGNDPGSDHEINVAKSLRRSRKVRVIPGDITQTICFVCGKHHKSYLCQHIDSKEEFYLTDCELDPMEDKIKKLLKI